MKNKNVLITGANSFIGANLTKRLISKGFEVNALVRKTSDKWRLEGILNLKEYEVDLRARKKLFEVVNHINPDIIFHLATAGVYGGVFLSNNVYVINNFIGSMNLIDACNNIDYKCFINTGSSTEYGPKNTPMSEDMVCTPTNMYGITKNAATKYGQMIAKKKEKPILSLRLFSPYGLYDRKERLIPTVIVKALNNKEIPCVNTKSARDYVFIDDVIDCYIKSIDKAGAYKGEIFNVGSGIQATITNVVKEIINMTGSRSNIKFGEYKAYSYDSSIWVADISKTKELLEWEPEHNLRQGLEKTVGWFKENLSIYE